MDTSRKHNAATEFVAELFLLSYLIVRLQTYVPFYFYLADQKKMSQVQPRFIYYFEGGALRFADEANDEENSTFKYLRNNYGDYNT
jgi:hypothetical protein